MLSAFAPVLFSKHNKEKEGYHFGRVKVVSSEGKEPARYVCNFTGRSYFANQIKKLGTLSIHAQK